MGGGNRAESSDVKVVGQFRVFVTEALIAGQPVSSYIHSLCIGIVCYHIIVWGCSIIVF